MCRAAEPAGAESWLAVTDAVGDFERQGRATVSLKIAYPNLVGKWAERLALPQGAARAR